MIEKDMNLTTSLLGRVEITIMPDLPVAVTLTPAGMFPDESVVNEGEPTGHPGTELESAPDSKQ